MLNNKWYYKSSYKNICNRHKDDDAQHNNYAALKKNEIKQNKNIHAIRNIIIFVFITKNNKNSNKKNFLKIKIIIIFLFNYSSKKKKK